MLGVKFYEGVEGEAFSLSEEDFAASVAAWGEECDLVAAMAAEEAVSLGSRCVVLDATGRVCGLLRAWASGVKVAKPWEVPLNAAACAGVNPEIYAQDLITVLSAALGLRQGLGALGEVLTSLENPTLESLRANAELLARAPRPVGAAYEALKLALALALPPSLDKVFGATSDAFFDAASRAPTAVDLSLIPSPLHRALFQLLVVAKAARYGFSGVIVLNRARVAFPRAAVGRVALALFELASEAMGRGCPFVAADEKPSLVSRAFSTALHTTIVTRLEDPDWWEWAVRSGLVEEGAKRDLSAADLVAYVRRWTGESFLVRLTPKPLERGEAV